MGKFDLLRLFVKWLNLRMKAIIALISGCFLFILLAILYQIDSRPSLYGAVLCGFIGVLWGIWDYVHFVQRFRKLHTVLENSKISIDSLPEPRGFIEQEYRRIIQELYDDRAVKISEIEKIKTETEDYYTLWVHQIKTPIAALGLLLQSDNPHSNTFSMEQELFKIEQYAEMVLQYLRLESLSFDLLLKEYSLYGLVRQAVKKYSSAFIGKKLSLTLEEFDFSVITDEKWLTFVLEQLISNCIKYTFKGGIHISLDAKHPRTLLIADTGIGIKPEDLPRIFDRGFTGYNGRMDKKSTGIGLYLCKKVTDRLQHPISVSSEPGKGTCYRICFPPRDTSLQK